MYFLKGPDPFWSFKASCCVQSLKAEKNCEDLKGIM